MNIISALLGICIFATAFGSRPAYFCEVRFDNFCPNNSISCANDPVLHIGNTTYSLFNFNFISFGDIYAPSGDIEGRMAVRNNANLSSFSVGYSISANASYYPFTVVVGGNARWKDGSVGSNERIFVGGDFSNAPSYLQTYRTGSCATPSCLDTDFNAAQAYFNDLSLAFASLPNNVAYTVKWGTLQLTCNASLDQYVFTISPAQFSNITYWDVGAACNPSAQVVVNIVGAGTQVKFAGATQTYFDDPLLGSTRFLYNVVPTLSTPSVRVEVGINGNLLAPDSNFIQPGMGVFIGQVVVANATQVEQINMITCQPPPIYQCTGRKWDCNNPGPDVVSCGANVGCDIDPIDTLKFCFWHTESDGISGICAEDFSCGNQQCYNSTDCPSTHVCIINSCCSAGPHDGRCAAKCL